MSTEMNSSPSSDNISSKEASAIKNIPSYLSITLDSWKLTLVVLAIMLGFLAASTYSHIGGSNGNTYLFKLFATSVMVVYFLGKTLLVRYTIIKNELDRSLHQVSSRYQNSISKDEKRDQKLTTACFMLGLSVIGFYMYGYLYYENQLLCQEWEELSTAWCNCIEVNIIKLVACGTIILSIYNLWTQHDESHELSTRAELKNFQVASENE